MDFHMLAGDLITTIQRIPHFDIIKEISSFAFGEMCVIKFLRDSDGTANPKIIAQKTGVSTARIAAVVNSLEKKELVTRENDAEDRRKIVVSLTDKGKIASDEMERAIYSKTEEVLARLGEDDSKEFIRILTKIIDTSESLHTKIHGKH